ncbi:uncharacterized protein BDZ99DRAFT_553294 [Mytilinidion resinicola]|uniref:Uncharacterized protein n=1 Tax=Mytilinidion resinicola TaxID=574789 RepID=A0A6A6XY24_9PEZI|nr:uncharacterized protein BDZ99DRAFT_553294 [Mytilinidion resinicola]KAF2801451.1 hypothetical protein BDZ99DRAFT_553294 [Mytilinidion resinicola]
MVVINQGRGRTLSRSSSIDSYRSDSSLVSKHMAERVGSHRDLIPPRYSGETDPDADRIVRIPILKRNIYVPSHGASPADLADFMWLLKFGGPEQWYERPEPVKLDRMTVLNAVGCLRCPPDELKALDNPRPLSLDVPQIWVSAALNTPTDDNVFDCMAGHGDFAGKCNQCTVGKREALEKTSLVYTLVLSTF